MIKEKISFETIIKITGLKEEELKELEKQMK